MYSTCFQIKLVLIVAVNNIYNNHVVTPHLPFPGAPLKTKTNIQRRPRPPSPRLLSARRQGGHLGEVQIGKFRDTQDPKLISIEGI